MSRRFGSGGVHAFTAAQEDEEKGRQARPCISSNEDWPQCVTGSTASVCIALLPGKAQTTTVQVVLAQVRMGQRRRSSARSAAVGVRSGTV
eukprot:3947131-Amphidinium_carterae.1